MEGQIDLKFHFRHCLLYEFKRGSTAGRAARNINAAYGEDSISRKAAYKWFARFIDGNFILEDEPRSGRPSGFDEDRLNDLIHENPRQTLRELAEQMNSSPQTVLNHLNAMGKVQKLGSWVPHQLSEENKLQRSIICASLLARQHREPFLKSVVTGDEKWVLYVNVKRRREWVSPDKNATPHPKPDLHPRKTMLSIWWDWKGIIHYELLEVNQTINSQLYSQQLQRLNDAIRQKRPRLQSVILQHDNARPHVANLTKMAILALGWEVLPHPPYSPDLAPSDYYLFRSLQNQLRGVSFNNDTELRNWLDDFFNGKRPDFFKRGIEKLVERWEKVVENEGDYIID